MKTNEKFKIETGVPIPTVCGKQERYPFGEMEVGNSFSFEGVEVSNVRQAASQHKRRKKNKVKFTVRKTLNGYRCWRVA